MPPYSTAPRRTEFVSCDKYVRVVSTYPECNDTSLDLPKVTIEQFTDTGIVAIDWELMETPATSNNTTVSISVPLPAFNTYISHKGDKGEDTNTNTETGTENNKVFRGRSTWFSDTTGS
ncbi:hypothetical protein EDD21DRAFT_359934 [Dissophora ornata]|nr:hypothetical protein EDD21DRAFT_359934 [Dissophora ornata]